MTEYAYEDITIRVADEKTHLLLGCTTVHPSGDDDLSNVVVTVGAMLHCGRLVKVAFYSESG